MRSLRWLLLVALIVVAAGVFKIYRVNRQYERGHRPNPPTPLQLDTKANALDWEWGQSSSGKPLVHIKAKKYKQSSAENKGSIEGLELTIFHKDGKHHDLVKSPAAQLDQDEGKLFSPSEVEIILNVPNEGKPSSQLTSVKTSGLDFSTKTGYASTDKPVSYAFKNGEGTAVGATYDPQQRELHLLHNVAINLKGQGPASKPMRVEAGELVYKEHDAVILLGPWSRMTRDQLVINAAQSTLKIRERKLDWIDAHNAKGIDKEPKRELDYGADLLHVQYNDSGEMEKMEGTGNASLVSHSIASDTTMTGDQVNMFFAMQNRKSALSTVQVAGKGNLVSKPAADPKGATPDTKILKADSIDMTMQPGGKELRRVQTRAPGTLEFIPAQAARHRRVLKGDRMTIDYGAKNQIQGFHADTAATETYPSQAELKRKKPNNLVAYTSSKALDAGFDDKEQVKELRQTGNFQYVEGTRKAQADFATLDNAKNVMVLERNARMADETGSTTADHIALQQATGDFDAVSHVATSRLPEPKKKNSSEMLDKDEPTLGTADRVTSANRNHLLHYIGNAVLWQTANRIQADRIDIDRDKKMLTADGQVVTQFQDAVKAVPETPAGGKPPAEKVVAAINPKPAAAAPIFTVVRAQHLVYTDNDRLAVYTGGASMWRPTMTVKSEVLKAVLNPDSSDEDSRINRAFSDGNVVIVQTTADRNRVGTSEHAEYYSEDGKIVLTGGDPQLDDTKRGNKTRGEKLTYFTDDDRLLVNGAPEKPVQSHLHRKRRS